MASTTTAKPALRHEEFCLPRPGETEPRIEGYSHFEDDPKTGRSRATHKVTRCLECGAARYDRLES